MPEQSVSTSGSGDQWVLPLLNAARTNNPLVADGVFDTLEVLLNGQISERGLNSTNLKTVAKQLIGDMVPKQPELGETE